MGAAVSILKTWCSIFLQSDAGRIQATTKPQVDCERRADSRVRDSRVRDSRVRDSRDSRVRDSRDSRVRDSRGSC